MPDPLRSGARSPRARWAALAVVGGLLAGAAPAQALDLHGQYRVREVTTDPSTGYRKDVTVAWNLTGDLYEGTGMPEASARPDVLGYEERTEYTYWDGEPYCRAVSFAGWLNGPQRESLGFRMPKQDRIRKRAAAEFTLWHGASYANREHRDCANGGDPWTDMVALVSSNSGTIQHRSVIGERDWQHMAPTTYLSPPKNLTFVLSNGWWRSSGTQTRTGAWGDGGTKTVEMTWNLKSRKPTRTCALPARRLVKGRTVAHARKLLKRAGLRYGRSMRDWSTRGVRPGRVTGYLASGDAPCGSRVAILVRAR